VVLVVVVVVVAVKLSFPYKSATLVAENCSLRLRENMKLWYGESGESRY